MMNKNSHSPEEQQLAEHLEALARGLRPHPHFERELEKRLLAAHSAEPAKNGFLGQALPTLGWTVGLIFLVLVLNWIFGSLVPQPAVDDTPTPASTSSISQAPTPTPIAASATVYEWHGTSLTLSVPLPDSPAEASVYLYQPEQRATLEGARALAQQLGLRGAVYGATDFLIVDGNERLTVHSDQSFEFYPDYPRWKAAINGATPPIDAEVRIDQFLTAHSFDFTHQIWPSEIYGGYFALPLTPDGHPICYEYFQCAGLHFTLDEKGFLSVGGALPKYDEIGQYGIIRAEEALQKILDPAVMSDTKAAAGMIEGTHSSSGPISTWLRPRPTDQTITIYGWLDSVPSSEGGTPLVTLDGYTVTGNTADIPAALSDTFVEATGQIHDQNGALTLELESWRSRDGAEDGLLGTISQRPDGQAVLNTIDSQTLLLPDAPVDLPLPLENAFVIGVRQGETFEWKSIDLRQAQGGGGGGGGGLGFYKLNLTGTPVPFPTSAPAPTSPATNGEGATYVVQAGDTLMKIASAFGVSVEALTQANGISDPSMLQIGQTLVIPGAAQNEPQEIDGQRGTLNITLYQQPDGSTRAEYMLGFIPHGQSYSTVMLLQGTGLEVLQAYQNRPITVWGAIEGYDQQRGMPILNVERYEVPFPDLTFQILRGTQRDAQVESETVTLFTTEEGRAYVQKVPFGDLDRALIGNPGDPVLLEGLIVPDETFGGYPVVHVFSGSMAINPKNGQPVEMQVTSDQIPLIDKPSAGVGLPTAAIERIDLVYYMPDPRNLKDELSSDQRYLQPAWLFKGHYSNGDEFFILVQALKAEYLLPEAAFYTPPG